VGKFIDLTGQRFGRLVAESVYGVNRFGLKMWLCKCDCGAEKVISSRSLTRGYTVSCGCYHKENTTKNNLTHNMTHTRLYNTWAHMKRRCLNPKNAHYGDYGGRGIGLCDKWLSFEGFYEDMGETYQEELTLDRIDNNGDYEKSNCRWATMEVQCNNKRNNRYITYNGVTDTLSNLCKINNIKRELIKDRLRAGWDIERAFKEPIHPTKPKRHNKPNK
jgi:hypothetical protein